MDQTVLFWLLVLTGGAAGTWASGRLEASTRGVKAKTYAQRRRVGHPAGRRGELAPTSPYRAREDAKRRLQLFGYY